MIAIDDEDDYNYHHACKVTATFKKFSSNQGYYNGTKSSNGSSSSSKRNVTYLNFLRKTRRKGSKDSFKATTPKRNVRKRQTLRVYWQKLLTNSTKSHIYKFVSSRNAKSLQNLCVNESFVSTLKSNTCITSKQLRFEDEQHCWEMRSVCHVKQSKSETSLTATLYESYKVSRLVANSASDKSFKFSTSCCTESESTLSAQKQYAKASKAHIKINRTFCSNKAHSSSNKRHTSDWSYNNYINKSNILEPNDSYRRTPKTIERLCTRKKRRLRRRRKRKGNFMRIEEMEEEHEDINHNTKTTKCTQQQFSTTYSSILETSNAPAVEGTTIEAMPIAVNAPTHDMLASLSAKLSSITVYRTVSLKNMPAIETLPKLSDCNAQHSNNSCTTFSSFCCSGGNASANDVKQPAKSSNSLATVATNICSASDVRTSTTISTSTSTSSSAIKTATATVTMSPAIRLSAFYAATTLRIFLTTLTTLIASTTPTAFTATKYSWIFLWIYVNLTARVGLAGYHEKRLLHDLLDPYNTLERPVLNESDPLQLSFGLTLMQIIDVDEKNQLLVTNVWLKLEWNDMNLRWNTSDYGGVKDLRIPPHRIWKPDVLMYNSADEGFDGTYQTNVVVRNNGSCLYVPPGIFKSTCKIDITWFPFDDQRCEMKFGSWTYDGFQLDLQLQDETGGDISSYVLNGEWELLGVPGKRNEIYYNCCPEPYIDITFAIIIRRRTLYYFFNLIIPCVLIASMALLGFTLPPDSGEKLSLGVTILLSLTVFLNMVAETMPATSDAVPLLGTYFNCIMFMVASSVVSTILILNYHHRNADTHEMSEWIRIVFLCWLPWILRMSRPGRPLILEFPTTPCSDTSSERKHQILSDVELKERSSKSLLANVLDIDDDFRHNCRPMTPGGTLPHNPAFYRTVYGQGDDGSIGPIGSTRMPDAVTHHTCIKSATEYELGLILKEIRFITDQQP